MSAEKIFGGNRDVLAELRAYVKANPDEARKMSLIQVIKTVQELKDDPTLQKILRQEGKDTTLLQAISLLTIRQGMEEAK